MLSNDNLISLLFGEENEGAIRLAFTALASIPPEKWREAIQAINHQESIMPMLDPSAWTNGKRFDNARAYKEIFSLALPLSRKLREIKDTSEKP